MSKTKQPPSKQKTQQRPKDHSLSENKDFNTSCYYISSSKTCKINGERNISKKSNSMEIGNRQKNILVF